MALHPIPRIWLRQVAKILRTGTSREIRKTERYSAEFQKSFPSNFEDQVTPALLAFLEGSKPHGCPVTMDHPPGETWEFWFTFKGKRTYGKILLRTNRTHIILHSAHLPNKNRLRCEDPNEQL